MAGKQTTELVQISGNPTSNWYIPLQDGANVTQKFLLEHLKRIRGYSPDTSVTPQTINLDQAATWDYEAVLVKDLNGFGATNAITINAFAGDLIDGSGSLVLEDDYAAVVIFKTGASSLSVVGFYNGEPSSNSAYNVASISSLDSPYTVPSNIDQVLVDLSSGSVDITIGSPTTPRDIDIKIIDGNPAVNPMSVETGTGELVELADPYVVNSINFQRANFTFRAIPSILEWILK